MMTPREIIQTWRVRKDPALLRKLNQEMHITGQFCGGEWERHVDRFLKWIPEGKSARVLDYGCGPFGGLSQRLSNCVGYDPYVKGFDDKPWAKDFDVFFSVDVFEHLTLVELRKLFDRIEESTIRALYLNISTRRAVLKLPNGANAHLTVKSPLWWARYLRKQLPSFEAARSEFDPDRKEWIVHLVGNTVGRKTA